MPDLSDALDDFYTKVLKTKRRSTGRAGASLCGWKPIKSLALKVHSTQIPEAMEHAKKHGCPTEFTSYGAPILASRSHRRAYLKSRGVHDECGGYGDG